MTIAELLKNKALDNCLLIGYYGGGNFGDELLLEVLQNMFKRAGYKNIAIRYVGIENYGKYHHDFGYELVDGTKFGNLLRAILAKKRIIIGGGGLWGLDTNISILVLGVVLFVARYVLRKEVYVIGTGYYGSAPQIGRISAWLTAKAANRIVVRDEESVRNFAKFGKSADLDKDIAFNISGLDLTAYEAEAAALARQTPIDGATTYVSLRKFRGEKGRIYETVVEQYISEHPGSDIVMSLLQPKEEYPEGQAFIDRMQAKYQVRTLQAQRNPLALYVYFKNNSSNLSFITPQFHAIIVAILCGIPFLPVVYDNKVEQLLKINKTEKALRIDDLSVDQINTYLRP